MKDFLLEVGVEELPPGPTPRALVDLERAARDGLLDLRLAHGEITMFATPRRLALLVRDLEERQRDEERVVTGPPVRIAYDAARKPLPPAVGFAKAQGVPIEALTVTTGEKGEVLAVRKMEVGRPAPDVLAEAVPRWVAALSFPKTMRWRDLAFRFPRPIRWIAALWGNDVLPLEIAGIRAGRTTHGHRVQSPGPHEIPRAVALPDVLRAHGILADPGERRTAIRKGLDRLAREVGGRWIEDEDLVEEVTWLVEAPTLLSGRFDPKFLELPREVLVTAMRSHQRYFSVEDPGGTLLPVFLFAANGAWKDSTPVVRGNERVLAARLADARFYWTVDTREPLETRVEHLGNVTWIEGAGSLLERARRLFLLARDVAVRIAPGTEEDAARAGLLAKADLVTEMIADGKEFTKLQGLIGSEYARVSGERPAVALAIREHYRPAGPGDPIPESGAGCAVSIADRLDTIVGCFAVGLVPTGSEDPYALRRAANGLLRILLERGSHLDLDEAIDLTLRGHGARFAGRPDLRGLVLAFLRDRTAARLKETGFDYDVAEAVMGAGRNDPLDAVKRAEALASHRGEPTFRKVVIGYKRAANILKGIDAGTLPDPATLTLPEPAELALHRATVEAGRDAGALAERAEYGALLDVLLRLADPIDRFFEAVMVMSDKEDERRRRLALLEAVRHLFHSSYDLSRIVVEEERTPGTK